MRLALLILSFIFLASSVMANDKIVVQILCSPGGQGSGVIVSRDGHVLTAAHVMPDGATCSASIGTTEGERVAITKERVAQGGLDAAIAKLDGNETFQQFATFCPLEKEIEITTAAFHPQMTGSPTRKNGIISMTEMSNGRVEFTAPVIPGESGGPVFLKGTEAIVGIVEGAGFDSQGNPIRYMVPAAPLAELGLTPADNCKSSDSIVNFIESFGTTTPVSTINSRLGMPISESILEDVLVKGSTSVPLMLRVYEVGDGSYFFVHTRADSTYVASGVFGNLDRHDTTLKPVQLRIPFMFRGNCPENGRCSEEYCPGINCDERWFFFLNDFALGDLLADSCGENILNKQFKDIDIDARFTHWSITDCYFGAPGRYMNYHFSFSFGYSRGMDVGAAHDSCFAEDETFWDSNKTFGSPGCNYMKLEPIFAMSTVDPDDLGKLDAPVLQNQILELLLWR